MTRIFFAKRGMTYPLHFYHLPPLLQPSNQPTQPRELHHVASSPRVVLFSPMLNMTAHSPRPSIFTSSKSGRRNGGMSMPPSILLESCRPPCAMSATRFMHNCWLEATQDALWEEARTQQRSSSPSMVPLAAESKG
jgi:hypothetical protein